MTTATRMSNRQFNKLMEQVHALHCQAFELGKKVVEESTSKSLNTNLNNAVVKMNRAFQSASKQDGFYLEARILFALGYADALYELDVDFSVELDTKEKADVKVNGCKYQLKLGNFDQPKRYLEMLKMHNVKLLVVRTANQSSRLGGYSLVEAVTKMLVDAGLEKEDVQDMSSLFDKLASMQAYL